MIDMTPGLFASHARRGGPHATRVGAYLTWGVVGASRLVERGMIDAGGNSGRTPAIASADGARIGVPSPLERYRRGPALHPLRRTGHACGLSHPPCRKAITLLTASCTAPGDTIFRVVADSPIRRFADSPATVTELASIHAPSWPCPPMPSLEVLRRLTRAAPQWVTPGKPKLPPSPPTDPRGGSKAARLRPRWGPSGRTGRATDREGAKL